MRSPIEKAAATAVNWWCPRHIVVAVQGPDRARSEVVVTKPFARIGRDERAEVVLADADVLPCQVYLHATNEGIYCTAFAPGSPNGWLTPTEAVEVGPFRVQASFSGGGVSLSSGGAQPGDSHPQAKHSAGPRVPRIRMFTDRSRTTYADHLLQRQLTIIGRQPPATWRIKHPTISRAHGALVWDGADLWLIDFFSSNGTRLGDTRCDAELVSLGQEFRLGMVTCGYVGIQPSTATPRVEDQPISISVADDRHDQRDVKPPQPMADVPHSGGPYRIDAQPGVGDAISPPHVTTGEHGSPPFPLTAEPGLASPSSAALQPDASAQAAMVDTRPLATDTRFVERSQRSLEDRLATVEAELAHQREKSADDASRLSAQLTQARQEIERLETSLRRERESHHDQQTQVAVLREQCHELNERVHAGLQSAADQLAAVEGMTIAKIAELRARQDNAEREAKLHRSHADQFLSVESIDDLPPDELPLNLPVRRGATKPPASAAVPDEFTNRLLDFQAKRERDAWLRRLIWSIVATMVVAAVVVATILGRNLVNHDATNANSPNPSTASPQADVKSSDDENADPPVSLPPADQSDAPAVPDQNLPPADE